MRKMTLFFTLASFAVTLSASAQNTDIEALAGVPFNFSNPGARSLGMGGAFIGLADDASAAEANPAGLTILPKAEVSFEGRNSRNEMSLPSTGQFLNQIDSQEFSNTKAQLAFASVVFPLGDFRVAGYFHQTIDYENEGLSGITFPNGRLALTPIRYQSNRVGGGAVDEAECVRLAAQCQRSILRPFVADVDVDMRTTGVALAYKFGNLSIGGAARHHTFKERATTTRFASDADGIFVRNVSIQGTLDPSTLGIEEETDLTFTAGFKWMTSGQRFSIGGVYKQGAEFDTPAFFSDLEGPLAVTQPQTKFHVPDIAGLGVSITPFTSSMMGGLRINFDAQHVQYSNLVDDFRSVFAGGRLLGVFEREDVTELRVGAELPIITKSIPFFIRAGYWLDPAHSLQYVGPVAADIPNAILFPGGEDENHYTVGVGLAWPSFQIDAAFDTSETSQVGSISLVTRF